MTWVNAIRLSGLIAWWVLALDVLVGTIISGNVAAYTLAPVKKLRLHRYFGFTLVLMASVHIIIIVLFNFKQFRTLNAWAPDNGTLARNTGIVTFLLVIVVVITSVLKNIIGRKWWRRFHFLTAPILVLGTIHGVFAGPDSTSLYVIIPGVIVITFMASVASSRLYYSYTKVRGNNKPRSLILRIITKPHGLHYKGPIIKEVRLILSKRKVKNEDP